MSADLLRFQLQSAAWANQRALSAAAQLTPEELTRDFQTSEHSVLGTLVHICRAERIWLARIEGQSLEFTAEGDDTLPALETNWPQVSRKWLHWAATLTDQTAQSDLAYRDLRQNPWTHPVWKIVLHVVNHSTHHRGQVIGFLRALGRTPPSTDSITFTRMLAPTDGT